MYPVGQLVHDVAPAAAYVPAPHLVYCANSVISPVCVLTKFVTLCLSLYDVPLLSAFVFHFENKYPPFPHLFAVNSFASRMDFNFTFGIYHQSDKIR